MTLTRAEQSYLAAQSLGRLATIAPDGSPQNKPIGYSWNPGLGTIDIYGFNMEQSQKFRNVAANPRVALVVDDAPGTGAAGMRFLEIRGLAETAWGQAPPEGGISPQIIRIRPCRVISWNIDPAHPGLQARDISADSERPDVA
jgi:pyridoxamine 5'-phosphate oxidase family protein